MRKRAVTTDATEVPSVVDDQRPRRDSRRRDLLSNCSPNDPHLPGSSSPERSAGGVVFDPYEDYMVRGPVSVPLSPIDGRVVNVLERRDRRSGPSSIGSRRRRQPEGSSTPCTRTENCIDPGSCRRLGCGVGAGDGVGATEELGAVVAGGEIEGLSIRITPAATHSRA